jgi:ABC-type glycerol-3-phosphate transport system substrate-binding protein
MIKSFISLVFIFLFLACNKKDGPQTSSYLKSRQFAPQTTLRFVGHWLDEGKKEQLLKEAITSFEFLNQDIDIKVDYLEKMGGVDFAQINAKLIASEDPAWDIVRVNNDFWKINLLLEKDWMPKYLVDFSEIPEFRDNTRTELLTDSFKAQFGGIIPGPMIDGYNWPLWCNTEVAKKVGITVKQFGMTYDDFIGYIEAVNAYNKQHSESIIPIQEANDFTTTHSLAEMIYFSELGDYNLIMNNNYNPLKVKTWENVLIQLEKLAKLNPLPKDWRKLVWLNTMNRPIEGNCLFFINGSWMYNIWLKNDPQKLLQMMPAEMPVNKPSPVCFGGYNITWVVPKKAKNKDAAVKFLLSMNTSETAEKWVRYTKSPTGVKGNLTTLSFGTDKFEDFQITVEKKYKNHKIGLLYGSAFCFGSKNSGVNNYAVEVISGEMTAQQAISLINKSIKR